MAAAAVGVTPDAFRRFGLVVACVALVVGLGVVWLWLSWIVALAAAVAGPLLALVLTVELDTDDQAAELAGVETEGLSSREIARRAGGR